MSIYKTGAAALLLALLCQDGVNAQFSGLVTLPRSDFTWRWGDWEDGRRRREDFSVSGQEGGFRCDLVGTFSLARNVTPSQLRSFENQLQSSVYFIQEAAYTMNQLDQGRDLDWAELTCVKPQSAERDPEEVQERVDRAREKAVQEMLERRERRERQEARDRE